MVPTILVSRSSVRDVGKELPRVGPGLSMLFLGRAGPKHNWKLSQHAYVPGIPQGQPPHRRALRLIITIDNTTTAAGGKCSRDWLQHGLLVACYLFNRFFEDAGNQSTAAADKIRYGRVPQLNVLLEAENTRIASSPSFCGSVLVNVGGILASLKHIYW